MSSWRDQILKEFTPKVARLTLVADPDGLLLEEGILEGIRERGFELIPFEDHIAFRYAYESKFRSHWDKGEQTDLVVVLRSQESDLGSLPYDLLAAGRKLSFNLGEIFPNLSYPVVAVLDRGDLDALYEAQKRHAPGHLGDNATKEFVLRHVFEIAPELIKELSDLLRVLLRRHYKGQRIPKILDERLIQILRQKDTFGKWPLEIIVPDREAFFSFLQERWPSFLDRIAFRENPCVNEDNKPYILKYPGPIDLPFEHDDIRVYIDNLFLEGLLQSVPYDHADALAKSWVNIGIQIDPIEDRSRRIKRLIERIQDSIPCEDARYGEWFHFAYKWAELTLLIHDAQGERDKKLWQLIMNLQSQIDRVFTAWLSRRYAGLINLPPVPPVMLHHLPRFLARQIGENRNSRMALILIDGLSLDQWIVIREALSLMQPDFLFRENNVFAWIPTITSVSRQSAFAGKPPVFFPNSIHTTDKEQAMWQQFWVDQGFSQNEIVYARGLGDGRLEAIEDMISDPRLRVAGMVIDKVDKIMHGMELGTAGMHNQVRQWAQKPYMTGLLKLLFDGGFQVFITSDHGNVEAVGCGRPSEGAIADIRGERVRIYSDMLLRDKVHERFPSSIKWETTGLPENYYPLISSNRDAFIREGEHIVSHGGVTIEELIVPLIEIERKGS